MSNDITVLEEIKENERNELVEVVKENKLINVENLDDIINNDKNFLALLYNMFTKEDIRKVLKIRLKNGGSLPFREILRWIGKSAKELEGYSIGVRRYTNKDSKVSDSKTEDNEILGLSFLDILKDGFSFNSNKNYFFSNGYKGFWPAFGNVAFGNVSLKENQGAYYPKSNYEIYLNNLTMELYFESYWKSNERHSFGGDAKFLTLFSTFVIDITETKQFLENLIDLIYEKNETTADLRQYFNDI